MFHVFHCTEIFLIMPHVLLYWVRWLCPHCAANMRPAPLLAWHRGADTLPPILALASLTNPQPCCLIHHHCHCRNCRCWDSSVESVSARHSLLCLPPWRRWPRLSWLGLGGGVTSRNCVKTFGHNNFSFQGNLH